MDREEGTTLLPLYRRGGNKHDARDEVVVGFARIDSGDAARLSGFVWRRLSSGYAGRWDTEKRLILLHREVLGLPRSEGPLTTTQGDHVNRDRLDNRRLNLRVATGAQNSQNKSRYRNNTSGHRGIHFDHRQRQWRAAVQVNGRKHRARYSTLEAAVAGVAALRARLMPFSEDAQLRQAPAA